jgi:hypothetical protein
MSSRDTSDFSDFLVCDAKCTLGGSLRSSSKAVVRRLEGLDAKERKAEGKRTL